MSNVVALEIPAARPFSVPRGPLICHNRRNFRVGLWHSEGGDGSIAISEGSTDGAHMNLTVLYAKVHRIALVNAEGAADIGAERDLSLAGDNAAMCDHTIDLSMRSTSTHSYDYSNKVLHAVSGVLPIQWTVAKVNSSAFRICAASNSIGGR